MMAAPAPAHAQPVRIHVALAGGNVTVPLAVPGQTEAITRRIYDLLGVEMQSILVSGVEYDVPLLHLVAARNAIRASLAVGGAPHAGQTCQVPVAAVTLPYWQPQVDAVTAELYEALGVDTVDLVFGGVTYTVLTPHVGCTRARLNAPVAAVPAPVGGAVPPVPTMATPVAGVTLQDFYRGAPSHADQVLARMFGARFMRLLDDNGALYWVLAGQPATDATVQRLGLLA